MTSHKNSTEEDNHHPAPFPEDIPFRLIKLFTFKDEIVLDPFMGKGTSIKMALITGRNAIGYELNKDYINLFLNDYINSDIKCSDYDKSHYYEYLKNTTTNILTSSNMGININVSI